MPNFVLFGQNGRMTITAATFRPMGQRPNNEDGFGVAPMIGGHNQNIMEFFDDIGDLVGRVDMYQYGNIVREDALRENL